MSNNNNNNNNESNEKFCTKCGKRFIAVGREVICPSCKAAAAEETKRAAVMRAKRASWNGESVPVRISGRASTVIREYGAAANLPFAQALDELLKDTQFVKGMDEMGVAWKDITPYKSHRRDKHATEDTASKPQDVQDAPHDVQAAGKPQEAPQEVKAARKAVKTSTSKAVKTSKATSTSTSKK